MNFARHSGGLGGKSVDVVHWARVVSGIGEHYRGRRGGARTGKCEGKGGGGRRRVRMVQYTYDSILDSYSKVKEVRDKRFEV